MKISFWQAIKGINGKMNVLIAMWNKPVSSPHTITRLIQIGHKPNSKSKTIKLLQKDEKRWSLRVGQIFLGTKSQTNKKNEKWISLKFLGLCGPVAKTAHSQCIEPGFHPWVRNRPTCQTKSSGLTNQRIPDSHKTQDRRFCKIQ